MAKLIEFNGEVVEFPDDMSDEQIESVLKGEASAAKPKGGTIADSLGQGALFGFSDEIAGGLGAGVNSIANLFGKGTGESFGQAYEGIRDAARMRHQAFAERNPGTDLGAQVAGGLVTGGVGAARAGAFQAAKTAPTLAGRLAPIIQTGAVQGGLYGTGASEGEDARGVAQDALKGAALGGATAPLLPLVAGGGRQVANRVFDTQTANRQFQKYADLLRDKVGIRLTTGQATGSESLRSIESTVGGTLTGGAVARQVNRNREQLQSKLMQMAGFPRNVASEGLVTADAINAASSRFSAQYNKLLRGKSVDLGTDDFVDRIADVQARNASKLPFEQRKQIGDIVDQVFDDVSNGPVNAERYNQVRSRLGDLERSFSQQPALASLYRELKHAIDDEVADQLNLGLRKRVLDRQYNRFTKIRDTFESSGSIGTSRGELPLSMLLRRAARRGKGADSEFTEIIRAGQAVLGDPQPNSGTITRGINAALLGGAAFDPTGASAGFLLGAPFGVSQLMSRGVTGGQAADRVIQGGLLTAPIINPIFGQPQ